MVLELCELLAELAERRASALADCTPTRVETTTTTTTTPTTTTEDGITAATTPTPTTTDTDPSNNKSPPMNSDNLQDKIVEQIVLYRRVLYYLEYVFDQVKKAFQNGRLKSTATARRRELLLSSSHSLATGFDGYDSTSVRRHALAN
ncbi:unnamed protein product [Trichobilharzia regenti]|nr:unnamed protein product [Trichobilharzia regenti]